MHPSSHRSIHPSPADFHIQADSEEGSDSEPEQHSFIPAIDSRSSSFSKSKSHRGVLTEQSAQNRQQRRLESASECTGSSVHKPKFINGNKMAKGTNRQAASKARAQMQATSKELKKSSGKKRRQEDSSDEEGPGNERPAKKNQTEASLVQHIDQGTQIQLLMKELQAQKRENEENEAVIHDLSSNRKKKRGKKGLKVQPFPINDKAKEGVSGAVVEFLFRGVKFLSTEDQLKCSCEDLMGDMT